MHLGNVRLDTSMILIANPARVVKAIIVIVVPRAAVSTLLVLVRSVPLAFIVRDWIRNPKVACAKKATSHQLHSFSLLVPVLVSLVSVKSVAQDTSVQAAQNSPVPVPAMLGFFPLPNPPIIARGL